MNNRINELVDQAGWWQPAGLPSDWDKGDYVVSPEGMKRFAELIIKECTETLKEVAVAYEGSETDADYASGVNDSIDILKNHFGVAE